MRSEGRIKLLSLLVSVAMLFVSFSGNARAEGGEGEIFSNKDLERYKMPSATDKKTIEQAQSGREERRAELKRAEEERDKEYWCKKGTQYGDKVGTAREDVEEAEKRLSEAKDKHFRANNKKKAGAAEMMQAEEKLEKTKKVLRNAERDLSKLEDEAHRKGVPPGWLRCQFE